ncbi:uncharacterized protein [Onthophagus taurus]|uniref:uncharacterized protein n=1 Tax=Onthophagus taurus TaxID=166361 RepID=UPI000C20F2A9|nr:uncharacterized protein LOC111414727 [Onthophagus taurus]
MISSFSFLIFYLLILSSKSEDVRLDILPPEEAKQIIDSKDQTLKYAPKIDSNVPAVRVLGKTPTNVLEDIYLANQYHGQDGLGSYLYGYSVPDIAKTEKKQAGGDLKGSYQYIVDDGKEIKVEYWDDGTGFHQVDNTAEIAPKQVDDSPDVKAAKEEFFKRWHEEAQRNSQGSNPPPNIPGSAHPGQNYPHGAQGSGFSSNLAGQQQPGQGGGQYQQPNLQSATGPAQVLNQRPNYGQQSPNDNTGDGGNWKYEPTPEEQGPPHGFFYNVDYPVGIIVNKQGQQKRETLQDIYVKNKENFERSVFEGMGNASGYQAHG